MRARMYVCTCVYDCVGVNYIYFVCVHDCSEGSSSIINPKPKGNHETIVYVYVCMICNCGCHM